MKAAETSQFIAALRADHTIAISNTVKDLWLADTKNSLRWVILPLLQMNFALLLHGIWFLKRLPLPQFSAHRLLQSLICWFCKYLVSYEACVLILRHFATESNLLNFLIANTKGQSMAAPVELYPLRIDDMHKDSFVRHDQELFRFFIETSDAKVRGGPLVWSNWRDIDQLNIQVKHRRTKFIDFETAHILFMCLFCSLLTAEEYEGAINSFSFDQSLAKRVEEITGLQGLVDLAYSKHPLFFAGPSNLHKRFLMHGLFTEYLNEALQGLKNRGPHE